MRVDSAFIADLRELCASNDFSQLRSLSPSSFSIGAVTELACLRIHTPTLRQIIDNWSKGCMILRNAIDALTNGKMPSTDDLWKPRYLEFYPIRGRNWNDRSFYHPFEARFVKAAKEQGFGDKADALAGAMFEMSDNAAQHSSSDDQSPAVGIIAYHISQGCLSFTVADIGRGALCSLMENPRWSQLSNSTEALMAIVQKQASRRIYAGDGEGFKELFKSIANLNGMVELRSQNGRVKVYASKNGRVADAGFVGNLSGFQLTVCCCLGAKNEEQFFPLDYLT